MSLVRFNVPRGTYMKWRIEIDKVMGVVYKSRTMMTLPEQIARKLTDVLRSELDGMLPEGFCAVVTASQDLRYGDYQSNAAMALAKTVRRNPRELAQAVVTRLGDMVEAEVSMAGPGFINFRIRAEEYARRMVEMLGDERLGVPLTEHPKKIVIDFSAPNVAKPMHVGHIRSTIIGDALARLARFMGHVVNRRCKEQPDLLEACKAELVLLQSGDVDNLTIWKRCIEVTKTGLKKIYAQLDIRFDYWLGESFYNDALAPLVEDLMERGIARESDGAVCVFSDGFHAPQDDPFLVSKDGEWQSVPAIIRKADGGFLYATTDLATLDYRIREFHADAIWYIVGAPQEKHFKQIFDIARMRGISGDFRHVAFGSILGKDRRPFKTRDGETVSLQDVIDEAVERAARVVQEKSPDMPESEKKVVAEAVGIGAIKFAELSQNRLSDYIFDWDKMLSLTGDTAPYLQNSYVRVRAIERKGGTPDFSVFLSGNGRMLLSEEREINLARVLCRFSEVTPTTLDDCRPNLLAAYLYELARAFHSFYEACPVLRSEDPVRSSRLTLCEITARVLKLGMSLLGIRMLEKM